MAATSVVLYQADNGDLLRMRVGSDEASLTVNPVATGTATAGRGRAKFTRHNSALGVRPRYAAMSRVDGTSGRIYRKRMPIFQSAKFADSNLQPGKTVTIGSNVWTIDFLYNESVR